MSAPKISVIIPTYNREKYILETLASVFAQSYSDYEIIVVDDGSTDGSKKLLTPIIKEKGLRLLEQENAGVSAARNRGVASAKGELIAFLDSDDIFHPEKLAKQIALLEANPQLGFVHSNFRKFNDSGQELGFRDMSRFQGNVYPQILQEWSALMALPTLLMPKKVFEEVGGFDEEIHWGEDIDLYFRVAKNYDLGLLPEVLCQVRVHSGTASSSKIGSAESFHRVLDKAVASDPDLSKSFVNKAYARLYTNKSQNILGEGNREEIKISRTLAKKAIGYQAFEIAAWFALFASYLPSFFRRRLVSGIRKLRYPASKGPKAIICAELIFRKSMHTKSDKLRILFLGSQMEVAGAQEVLLSQAKWFAEQGHSVSTVFFYDKQGLSEKWKKKYPFPVRHLDAWRYKAFPLTNYFRAFVGMVKLWKTMRKSFDVIETFTPHSNVLGLPVAFLAGVPVRLPTHHGYIEDSSKWLARIHGMLVNSSLSSKLVAVSSQVKFYAIEQEKIDAGNIVVIENGIEATPDITMSEQQIRELRKNIGLSGGDNILLTTGRLTIQKGHTVLLKAIAQKKSQLMNSVFVFAGDGPQRGALEREAKDLGIDDLVRFIGIRSDVPGLLHLADIFVQPSLWEGLSLAMLEALYSGTPVLATAVEGVVDVIESGRTGILVEAGNEQALGDALLELLGDADLRKKLGKAGAAHVKQNYGIDRMCEQYENLMLQLHDDHAKRLG